MVDIALCRLKKLNIPACREVGFLSRSLDLVMNCGNDFFTVVEFKRNDWQRAIKQAKTHFLGADRVYICLLPLRKITEKMKKEFIRNEIGLYFFNKSLDYPFEEKIPSSSSKFKNSIYRDWLKEAFFEKLKQ